MSLAVLTTNSRGSACPKRTEPRPEGAVFVLLGSAAGARGKLPHLLRHLLLHFLGRGVLNVRSNHPLVAVGIDHGATTIAPEHVHYRTFRLSAQLDGLSDHFVHVFR